MVLVCILGMNDDVVNLRTLSLSIGVEDDTIEGHSD